MVKVTFTLDAATVAALKRIAQRTGKPQSAILREAVPFYEPYAGQLSADERRQRVARFDDVLAAIPKRPAAAVDAELADVRRGRRQGWRRATGHQR